MIATFHCIDGHTCGNPVRVIAEGGPDLKGKNMMEKRLHFLEKYDWIRQGLMFEPRGHDMMSGSILYPPSDPANDVGVLFIETSGCLPMCGHGTIGTVTIALESGLLKPLIPGKLRLETPAGLVLIDYVQIGDKITSVKLKNVASFLHSSNLTIHSEYLGNITFDVAYGGNFYAIVDPQINFAGIDQHTAGEIISWSQEIRQKIQEKYTFIHPTNNDIHGLSHMMWTGKTINKNSTARNAVFYGKKAIDRSPCGTGTSARMAQWAAKGLLEKGHPFIHESFIGSTFTGRIEEYTKCGEYDAIIPSIEGWAKVYGTNTISIDTDDDPYALGFQVL